MLYRLPYGVLDPQAQSGALECPCVTVTELLKAARIKYAGIVEFYVENSNYL